ncbi:STE3-domain-containing protein [Artomyces pyxidatus]|uniref:STE3-domain-containing protein n=1 Tax=Artomyces pyxidatus TaxID=48021 RepID=A0ACB8SUE9_9AGAM|nr:STE3-domain-containing protein [Artomyces pyxidatus]
MAEHSNAAFSAFAFIGFLLSAIPVYWNLESWNTGTCLYIAWIGLGCLNAFINSVVWNQSVLIVAPVWCDLSTRFMVGLSVAVPAASLVINRRLYNIASMMAPSTYGEKRRGIIIDLAIGLGVPLLQMILQIVVEGHRFDIIEDVGCYPFTFDTPLAYPLVLAWPLVISLTSLGYCALTLRLIWRYSQQVNNAISFHHNLSQSRYFRLMALASIAMVFRIPLSVYSICLAAVSPISPWISWNDTHRDFGHIEQVPGVVWRSNHIEMVFIELDRWFLVLCAFIFFGLFGFADESRDQYRRTYKFIASKLGFDATQSRHDPTILDFPLPRKSPKSFKGGISLPLFSSAKRNSMQSSEHRLSSSITIEDWGNYDESFFKPPQLEPPVRPPRPPSLNLMPSVPSPKARNTLTVPKPPLHDPDAPVSARSLSVYSDRWNTS